VFYVRFKNHEQLEFEALNQRRVEARFDEPQVTSDFGVVLLRELESKRLARVICYFGFPWSNLVVSVILRTFDFQTDVKCCRELSRSKSDRSDGSPAGPRPARCRWDGTASRFFLSFGRYRRSRRYINEHPTSKDR